MYNEFGKKISKTAVKRYRKKRKKLKKATHLKTTGGRDDDCDGDADTDE